MTSSEHGLQRAQRALTIGERVAALAWPSLHSALDTRGFVTLPRLLTPDECTGQVSLYAEAARFRSRVVMARHGYGRGEYQYFADPLPPLVTALREAVYEPLVPLANGWQERQREPRRFPATLAALHAECRELGQVRPTPLLLKYGRDDYNCLHQDLYGDLAFPLQLAVLLSEPCDDFAGGEFVLTEQRPRMQLRVEVVPMRRGDAVVFAVHRRPVHGPRGDYRVNMRHGVSRVLHGARYTLGVIFHQAK